MWRILIITRSNIALSFKRGNDNTQEHSFWRTCCFICFLMNILLSQPSFLTLFCYEYILLKQSFILRLFCYEHTVLSQPPVCTLFCYEHSLLSQPSILTLLCTSAPVNRHPLTSRCDIKQLGSLGPVLNMTKVSQQTESVSMGVLLNIYQQNFKCKISVSVI